MFAARPGPPGVLPVGPPQISSIFPGGRTLLRKQEGRFPAVSRGSAPPQGGGAPPMPPHPSLVASWGLVSGQAAGLGHSEQKGPWGQRLGQWPMGRRGPGLPPQDWAQSPPSTEGRGRCVLADGRSTGSARRGRIPGESAASARTPPPSHRPAGLALALPQAAPAVARKPRSCPAFPKGVNCPPPRAGARVGCGGAAAWSWGPCK